MKKSTFLAWIIRMPLIKRWALMHSVKKENIAEHSHQVAVIAHLLVLIRNQYFGGNLNPEKAATIALYHEVSETKLQDINHVTKYHNPELTKEFKKLEEIAEIECLKTLPIELQSAFEGLIVQSKVDPAYKTIVKAADLISAYLKACDEVKFGNREFDHVKIRLESMLDVFKTELKEVEYLLDVFFENCFVNVDQLSKQDI
ncbi:5'-deoxynucleotidase [Aliiglaciecola sp. LCG003]|uniref:5'-deoxynucleotidase n=1 Tax=Aliiglaciecola sp. LCG003 TaxID=3053655 RepID=UPI0025743BB3|nr:5'-deoxynucleotidase [Aliiglaciecola sp. LCG003]WJG07677.1 5'-deoxynucleotidase [Aliiglaciecola sp. LCG003]